MRDSKPQAFPVGAPDGGYVRPGMTLRDWFAGQALVGCLTGDRSFSDFDNLAEECYTAADAMLAEREREP